MPETSDPGSFELQADYGAGLARELESWRLAALVLDTIDYESQLAAIRSLIHRNRETEKHLDVEMQKLVDAARGTSGWLNEQITEDYGERFFESVYQGAAHSMAAVGMLAPFIESLFSEALRNIGRAQRAATPSNTSHVRWLESEKAGWDCHFYWSEGRPSKNLVNGIIQLIEAIGLAPQLPPDLLQTLEALFTYRNKMFHCGFEWPIEERRKFEQQRKTKHWTKWFEPAEHEGEPWVFYMTDAFVEHCLTTIDKVIEGIGAFVEAEGKREGFDSMTEAAHGWLRTRALSSRR